MARRSLFEKLIHHLPKKEYTILTGARQTGKSTLLKQLQAQAESEGLPTIFLNLENKAILGDLDEHPLHLLKYLPDLDQRCIVLIDEVQYLKDPSNFLKLLYDQHAEKMKIVATGSSAFYLDDRFRDSLAGRKKIFQLFTCSFKEYLDLAGKGELIQELERIESNPRARSVSIESLRNEWESYVLYGGYPAIITEPDRRGKIDRLREIRDSFVKRDILESGVVNENAFYDLFRVLAAQSGNLLNVNELSTTLRIKNATVNNYLSIMQKCFHVAIVRPFYRNLRKELVKMPKAYLLDTGLRNCLINNFDPLATRLDRGELWENTVFRLLVDKYGLDEISFWRTAEGNETDFVLAHAERPKALEAKYDQLQVKHSKYNLFKKTYPQIPLSFIWHTPFDEGFFRRIKEM